MNTTVQSSAKALSLAVFTSLAAVLSCHQPSLAQSTTFFCDRNSQGVLTTYAQTKSRNVPVIRWKSWDFAAAGYTPEQRCEEVSRRFQTYKNNGMLNYITTGIMNRQSVVCVSSAKGGGCQGLLFTLKPGANASRVLQQLFDISEGKSNTVVYESFGSSRNTPTDTNYIDVNQLLNITPEESTSDPTPSTQPEVISPERVW
ncbi:MULTISPECIES: COP23 domain-containing protein [Calothrix]|uniref:Circadian oscillating protein COP23 n=2 Tax=Calothrix TaxID=1186 RepID=A0ABR8AKL8_9CYAN|nr:MULTISPECIES: COP23 domain-containing protein [Calothrix]MBD2199162.1 hypothetical protein [Calothrix parietina FACHB-288]MBD2227864.1 hypothetical protein [Calothrix anomala FACHB-343]